MLKDLNEEKEDHWEQFQNGLTIETEGPERGVIINDEEHDMGARITLEKANKGAPYRITCGIYGWMVHTCFFSNEVQAISGYKEMKLELSKMLVEKQEIDLAKEISDFVQKF